MKMSLFYLSLFTLFLYGCENSGNRMHKYATELSISKTATEEHQNALTLQRFIQKEHYPFSIELFLQGLGKQVMTSEIQKYRLEALVVIISTTDNQKEVAWKPIDNNNIFILLRE